MDRRTDVAMGEALDALALKDMDPSLLAFAILREAARAGVDLDTLVTAMELAAYLHRDDVRSSRKRLPVDPYVTHPFRLVLRLLRYGCRDVAVLSAAALHDTVEDHPDELVEVLEGPATSAAPAPLTPEARQDRAVDLLTARFGADVARIVRAVTNLPQPAGRGVEERQEAYRDHLAEVVGDPQVFLVKFADFVDNAGSLHHLDDDERRERLEAKYAPLLPLFEATLARHRDELGLHAEGLCQVDEHLAAIGGRIG